MKKIDVLNLEQTIESLKNVKNLHFAYALMRNKKLIDSDKDSLITAIIPIDNYKLFVDEVNKLIAEYCLPHKDELVIVENLKPKENKDFGEFKDKLKELHVKYAEQIKGKRAQLKEYNAFLADEASLSFYKIKNQHLPEELTFGQLYPLIELINFNQDPDTLYSTELTKLQILTSLELFPIDIVSNPARDILLQNALILKNVSRGLLMEPQMLGWNQYEQERKALAESFSRIDVYGDVLIYGVREQSGNKFAIEDQPAFDAALAELNKRHEETLKNFYAFIAEKTHVMLYKLTEDMLPANFSFEELKTIEVFLA